MNDSLTKDYDPEKITITYPCAKIIDGKLYKMDGKCLGTVQHIFEDARTGDIMCDTEKGTWILG